MFALSFTQAQTVDQIITDYEGYWVSGQGSINSIEPENSHNLLGFRFGGTTFSTGVDDAKLTQEGVTFTPANFRALPFNSLPTSGGGAYYIGLGQLFDGIDNGVNSSSTEPFEANLSGQELTQFLTNGEKGLNLGSGFANIPSSNSFEFRLSANGIEPSAIGDNIPDILISQIAQPSGSFDLARLVDASGNMVGTEVSFRLDNNSSAPRLASWIIDFYRLNSTAGITNTRRDIRFIALDVSSFGITAANVGSVVALEYTFSGSSDPAFIAYNEESLSVAREIEVVSQPTVSDCNGEMAQDFVVQVQDFNGAPVEQAGFAITAFIETGPGELLGTLTQTTNALGQATFDDLVFEIGDFHSIRFENTSMEPGISAVVNLVGTCVDSEWTGAVSNEWNNTSNWLNGEIPNANFNVLIPSGAPRYPVLLSNAGAKDLTMEDDTSIVINGNVFAISGDVTRGNNSLINGSTPGSNLYFSGTSAQTIPDNFISGNLDILTIENASGVTSNTDITLTSLLDVINGDFDTNDRLTLACQFTPVRKTAQVGEVTGSISGGVTVEQCFPANRAFRFVTSSVNTSTSIRANWQDNPSNYLDVPRLNYGTHITGVEPGSSNATVGQDGQNGFDYNPSGNPSMFTFDNLNASWSMAMNTTDNLSVGRPYRLMIRGDRTIDITSNSAPPTDTKLSAFGTLTTGSLTTSTPLNSNSGSFNLVGNPYHAQVDMDQVLTASANLRPRVFYVWDPTISTRGAYVTVSKVAGNWSNNNSSSSANQYLQPMQSVFVETSTLSSTPALNFTESQKVVSNPQTTTFSVDETEYLQLNLYAEDEVSSDLFSVDGLKLFFGDDFENEINDDFHKMGNDDENLARVESNSFLSVELRQYPKEEEILDLFINNYKHFNYTLEFVDIENLSNYKVYLKDAYLNELTEMTSSENTYAFSIDNSIPESVATDRFSLVFEPESLSTVEESLSTLSLYPNPTQGSFSITGRDLEQGAELEIYNMLGQQVYKQSLSGQSTIEVTDFKANTGIYLVKLKTNQGERTFKLIKQ